jgi:hydroxyacylglutathione hydrolase
VISVIPLETPSLGDRSYVAHDGSVAIVVDPQRDIDRVLELVGRLGVRVTHVVETHIHNDYVTGGLALARLTGAAYLVNGDDPVSFERQPVRDGDVVRTGSLELRALLTPGHTFTHLSYALSDARTGEAIGVFTGGSLLFGSTGRPDLLGQQHAETLARHQHASAHRLARELPGDAAVFPTHGFGSFCSATQSEGVSSTIAQERRHNPALTDDEETYVRELLAGLDAFPAYYAHMGPANAAGPADIDLTPPTEADPAELRRRIEAGEWVVDLRTRTAFAAGHVRGTLNFGLDGSFVTYLGWLIPWGTPVTLLGETAEDVAAAQRDLARIGIDRPAAIGVGKPEDLVSDDEALASYVTVRFADVAAAWRDGDDLFVLDVRRADERRGGAVRGSTHVPLHELLRRIDELPRDRALWVHCATGYRASIASSVLQRAGFEVFHIDDEFTKAEPAGLL